MPQASSESGSRRSREIERLKAAIFALGDSSTLSKPLQEVFRASQVRASVPLIQDSFKFFLAKKRAQRAREQKVVHETEVVQGAARLAKVMAEAAIAQTPLCSVPTGFSPCDSNRRQGTWMGGGPPRFERHPIHSHFQCSGRANAIVVK